MAKTLKRTKFPENNSLNLRENLKDKYVAFIDVMGFSNLVNKGNIDNLESYFSKITDVLDRIRVDKESIESFLISDSIILIAPDTIDGLKQLLAAIRRIQSALLWRKILLRGAVSYGQIYYNADKNIVVGKGFIKAYLLESEAIFPRVIIDPSIIKKNSQDKADFLFLINGTKEYNFEERLVYSKSDFSKIVDDGIFIDYANKTIQKEEINGSIKKIYEVISENLYGEQKLYSKYVWLRDYFLECLILTAAFTSYSTKSEKLHKDKLNEWINKFDRL
jgi:hypothetical protein